MQDQADLASRPWRRYLRFSVRGLIVLVLVIGGGLGWMVRSARIQRGAVAAIERAGGSVLYDWEWLDGKGQPVRGGEPWAPTWFVDLIGADYFRNVVAVEFLASSTPNDVLIAQVGQLTGLQQSRVFAPSLTDVSLARLEGLTKLFKLRLYGTQVTDAGLAHLKGLTGLDSLCLEHTHVTDAGLAHLRGLTKLSYLHIGHTAVTDAGVKELQQALPSLKITR